NGGPSAASAIKVSDTLPAGVKLMGASGDGWTCSGTGTGPTTVTCTRDSLAAPTAPPPAKIAAPDITITVAAPLEGPQTISNKPSVSSAIPLLHPDKPFSNEVTTDVVPVADLSITKTASSVTVKSGDQFTYTVSVKNAGPSTASSVIVTDTPPAGVKVVSASGAGWICSVTAAVTCTRTSLPVGAAPDISLSVTVSGVGGTISNQASVTTSETSGTFDPNLSNNSATAQTVVNQQVDEKTPLSFKVSATDSSGNPVTFSASSLPQGASFDAGT